MFISRKMMQNSFIRRCFCNTSLDDAVSELNKEMETIFGKPLASSDLSCSSSFEKAQFTPYESNKQPNSLTHIDASSGAWMVDVSGKDETKRIAVGSCRVLLGEKAFNLVAANQFSKGDVLGVARIAGISGAKQTSNLIPLCHNVSLTHVRVDMILNEKDHSVEIEGEAATTGKTGVEMEAMTAVTIAGLTVYDMCKAASKDIQITDVCLKHKIGGKSGDWHRRK